jgi:hypothetical protein
MGLPFEVAEIGMGHKIRGVAGRYINLTDKQISEAFQQMYRRMATRDEAKNWQRGGNTENGGA